MTVKRSAAATRMAPPARAFSPALVLILLLAAFLRLWKIDSPVGGFHAFNEALYTLIAKNLAEGGSLLRPTAGGTWLFLETPPLLPYALAGIFHFTGVSIVAGRLVSVVSGVLLVLAVYSLGRRLYSAPAGLTAAVLVAVAPVAVLTGRNIQADTLCLFLLAAAYSFWGRAEGGAAGSRILAGLLAGLSLFAKLFAGVGLAALLAWEIATSGLSFLRDKARWAAALIALSVPGAFYGYHASRDLEAVRREVLGGAVIATSFPADGAAWASLAAEAFWAFSPLVAVLAALGALAALARPSRETLFALLPLAFFGVFYLFVHKHSYYLLSLLPWAALLAGRLLGGLPWRWLRGAVLIVVAASGVFVSTVDLCSMKLGFSEFASFGHTAADLPGPEHLYRTGPDVRENYGTVVQLYDPKAKLLSGAAAPAGRPEETWLLAFVPPQARIPSGGWLFERERYGLELFGFSFAEAHENANFFSQGHYLVVRTGGPLDFGLHQLHRYPALALAPLGGSGP